MTTKTIITPSQYNTDTFFIFRNNGTEITVEVIRETVRGEKLETPFLRCSTFLTEQEKNDIFKMIGL